MTDTIDAVPQHRIAKTLFRWTAGRFEPAVPPDWYVRAWKEAKSDDWSAFGCRRMTSYGEPDLLEIDVSETPDGDRYVLVMDDTRSVWEALVAPADWPHFFRDEVLPLITAAMQIETRQQIGRLAAATIGIGRHGLKTDLDEITGYSRRDQWEERQRILEARKRMQAQERRA